MAERIFFLPDRFFNAASVSLINVSSSTQSSLELFFMNFLPGLFKLVSPLLLLFPGVADTNARFFCGSMLSCVMFSTFFLFFLLSGEFCSSLALAERELLLREILRCCLRAAVMLGVELRLKQRRNGDMVG